MNARLREIVKHRVQDALGRFGFRVARWPESSAGERGVSDVARFFPVGRVGPWEVPLDLRANTAEWAKTIVRVYDDHASWPSSIVPEGGLWLHALVRNIQPTLIVETGTSLGVSTTWMASALRANGKGVLRTYDDYRAAPDARLAASALFQNRMEGVRSRIEAAGLSEIVTLRAGDSVALLKEDRDQIRALGGVQFAFIDADHSPEGTVADFQAIEPVLAVGGYVVVHDVFPEIANHLGPRVLVDQISSFAAGRYESCDIYTAQTNYGLTILRRIG